MKKLLLVTAIAAASVSVAQAAPTVYGKAFVTADYVNIDIDNSINSLDRDENGLEIYSHTSRIGFKGAEEMTANTDVIYQLEYGIRIDGDDRTFQSRDTYLGVKNKDFGEFRVGRNYSVIDYINNVKVNQGYWDNLVPGTTDFKKQDIVKALNMTDGNRVNNSVVWKAPKYEGIPLELALMYGADESFGSNDNGYGASLMFKPGTGYTAGLAYSKDLNAVDEIIRGTVSVDLGKYVAAPVTVGVMYQQADFDNSSKEKGLVVSGEMGLNNFAKPASVYLQYNKTDNLGGNTNFDSDQIVLGGKYKYKSNMIAHAYIGQNSADYAGATKDVPSVAYTVDADVFAVGGGLEYIF